MLIDGQILIYQRKFGRFWHGGTLYLLAVVITQHIHFAKRKYEEAEESIAFLFEQDLNETVSKYNTYEKYCRRPSIKTVIIECGNFTKELL